jgi:hypothetical protein
VPTRSPFHYDDVVLVGSNVVRIHIDKSYIATLAMRVTVLYASGATAAQQIDATATVGALLCTVRQGDGAMAPPLGRSDIATADTIGDGRAFDMHAGFPPRQLLASAVMSDVVADGSTIYCDFAPDSRIVIAQEPAHITTMSEPAAPARRARLRQVLRHLQVEPAETVCRVRRGAQSGRNATRRVPRRGRQMQS